MQPTGQKIKDVRYTATILGSCNGGSAAILGAIIVAASLALGSKNNVVAGMVIASAGIMEFAGAIQVSQCKVKGFRFLQASQWLLFISLASFLFVNAFSFSFAKLSATEFGKMIADSILDIGIKESVAHTALCVSALILIVLSALLQGGMWWFYGRLKQKFLAA